MTIIPEQIQPGDWVRFYSNGKLVVGVVQYPVYRRTIAKYVDTDAGAVDVEMIREIRKAIEGRPADQETR